MEFDPTSSFKKPHYNNPEKDELPEPFELIEFDKICKPKYEQITPLIEYCVCLDLVRGYPLSRIKKRRNVHNQAAYQIADVREKWIRHFKIIGRELLFDAFVLKIERVGRFLAKQMENEETPIDQRIRCAEILMKGCTDVWEKKQLGEHYKQMLENQNARQPQILSIESVDGNGSERGLGPPPPLRNGNGAPEENGDEH